MTPAWSKLVRRRTDRAGNGSAGAMPEGYSSTAGLGFDDEALESRLAWIWGSPRSGSTWLLQLLSHPLGPDPETLLGFAPPSDGGGPYDCVPIDESFLSNHLAPALADPRLVGSDWIPGTLNNYLASAKPAYAFSDAYRKVWRPEARRFALVRIQGVLAQARHAGIPLTSAPHVVIKETNGAHASDIVMSLMPRARLILLIRDGRDVTDSLLAAYQPGGFLANNQGQSFGTPDERAKGLRWAAKLWACNTDTVLRAIDSHPAELCRVIRYEDLRADTVGEVSALFEWLGVERSPEQVARTVEDLTFDKIPAERRGPLTRNRSARPGTWRENLSEDEQGEIREIFGDRLRRFGYQD